MLDGFGTIHKARKGPKDVARGWFVNLLGVLCLLLMSPNASAVEVKTIQQYAGSLLTPLEFSNALVLWDKESNWNIRAHNGSHWGLCQGRSTYMKSADYKQQVQWCIKYARHRYGSIALALEHWRKHKWH